MISPPADTTLDDLQLGGERCVDAYLAWDVLSGHARHGGDERPRHLPVMVEFEAANAADAMAAWAARVERSHPVDGPLLRAGFAASVDRAPYSRLHTALLHRSLLPHLLAGVADGTLQRFQLGAPCKQVDRNDGAVPWTDALPAGQTVTLGVIDDGCCLAHQDYRSPTGASRFLAVWDQEPAPLVPGPWMRYGVGPRGLPCGYGSELSRSDIEAVLRQPGCRRLGERGERLVYQALGRAEWGQPDRTHGARVLHLMAGPLAATERRERDAASMPIVFVQLPDQTVGDTSGDSLGMHVVDGARYIVQRTRAAAELAGVTDWRTVINISLGSIAGPHDGTSMAERALAELVVHWKGRVTIVAAAGNTGDPRRRTVARGRRVQGPGPVKGGATAAADPVVRRIELIPAVETADTQRIHACRSVHAGQPGRFLVGVPPDCGHDSFVELWLPTSAQMGPDGFSVTVTGPDGVATAAPVGVGQAVALRDADGTLQAGVVFARQVAQGLRGHLVLVAMVSTARSRQIPRTPGRPGFWTIEVRSTHTAAAVVHAWVERDDIIVGARRPQRTRFEHEGTDVNDTSYIDDRFTLSNLANGAGVLVAGGYVVSRDEVASYSGNGPRRGESEIDRPQWFAPSDRTPTLRGLRVPGFFSGTRSTLGGTSAAAPQVARRQAEGPPGESSPVTSPRPVARDPGRVPAGAEWIAPPGGR
ncbi:S8 family serine peptidase [Ideonella sp. A 288]|uniref:S8 family serine peptidase n=1 Tax=Ideonella sp. A 288 TaxID=1962181 RepID=UPI00118544A7|nr:S8 family serine peptidase [Ideonella sp. A 288]